MSDLNNCTFTGRLGADPEHRYTQSGKSVATFSLGNRDAYKKEITHWIKVTTFGKQADFIAQHMKSGSGVSVVGRLVSSKYTDRAGQERTGWEILADRVGFNGPKPAQDNSGTHTGTPQEYSRPHQQPQDNGGWQQQPQQQHQGWGQGGTAQETWGNGNGGGWNNA